MNVFEYIANAEETLLQKLNQQVTHVLVSRDVFIKVLNDPMVLVDSASGSVVYGIMQIHLAALEDNTIAFTNEMNLILAKGSLPIADQPATFFMKPIQTIEEDMLKFLTRKKDGVETGSPQNQVGAIITDSAEQRLSKPGFKRGDALFLEAATEGGPVHVPVTFSGWNGENAIILHRNGDFQEVSGTSGLTVA